MDEIEQYRRGLRTRYEMFETTLQHIKEIEQKLAAATVASRRSLVTNCYFDCVNLVGLGDIVRVEVWTVNGDTGPSTMFSSFWTYGWEKDSTSVQPIGTVDVNAFIALIVERSKTCSGCDKRVTQCCCDEDPDDEDDEHCENCGAIGDTDDRNLCSDCQDDEDDDDDDSYCDDDDDEDEDEDDDEDDDDDDD